MLTPEVKLEPFGFSMGTLEVLQTVTAFAGTHRARFHVGRPCSPKMPAEVLAMCELFEHLLPRLFPEIFHFIVSMINNPFAVRKLPSIFHSHPLLPGQALVKWTPEQVSCMLEGRPPTPPPAGLTHGLSVWRKESRSYFHFRI